LLKYISLLGVISGLVSCTSIESCSQVYGQIKGGVEYTQVK